MHGDVTVGILARQRVKAPVSEYPILLTLNIVVGVTPGQATQVALDEAANAIAEAHTRIGADQGLPGPVCVDQIVMQLDGCWHVVVHGLSDVLRQVLEYRPLVLASGILNAYCPWARSRSIRRPRAGNPARRLGRTTTNYTLSGGAEANGARPVLPQPGDAHTRPSPACGPDRPSTAPVRARTRVHRWDERTMLPPER